MAGEIGVLKEAVAPAIAVAVSAGKRAVRMAAITVAKDTRA